MMINRRPSISQSSINIPFLQQSDLQNLTFEQRKWAQTQFRNMYAQVESMAKITSELQHQQRIKANLENLEKQKDEEIRLNLIRLKQKMEGFDKQRLKKYQEKVKKIKINDEKWNKRLENIQSKFKRQNRAAIEKAQQFRQQSEDYWLKKQTQTKVQKDIPNHKFRMNKTEKLLLNNVHENQITNSHFKTLHGKTRHSSLRIQSMLNTLRQDQPTVNIFPQTSRCDPKSSRTIDIDGQIYKHKQKSQYLQKEREQIVFQNAMKRLAKIQNNRKKSQKLKQPLKSAVQIRKPKRKSRQNEQNDLYKGSSSNNKSNGILPESKSKNSLLDQQIQSHIKAKRLLQQKEFEYRNKIVNDQQIRKKKDRILGLIKKKIKEIKYQTVKNQMLIK